MMTELGQVLGTLVASLAHARRIADEETAVIAEYYKDNPLLENMSVPRVRVPELRLDLPIIFKSYEQGIAPVLEDDETIVNNLLETLQASQMKEEFSLDDKLPTTFRKNLYNELTKLRATTTINTQIQREHVTRIVDNVFSKTTEELKLTNKIPQPKLIQVVGNLRKTARESALKSPALPPKIEASIITSEVKEQASAGNVVRLQINMKEEGLEWDIVRHDDGTVSSRLSPE